MAIVSLPYIPKKWQLVAQQSFKKYSTLVVHRRAGKTVLTVNHLIQQAIIKPNGRFAYIAPQRGQAKDIAWDELKKYTEGLKGVSFNEAELRCNLPNGSRITLYGVLENPEALRGRGFDGVVIDESQDIPLHTWETVIYPTTTDAGRNAWIIFIGTPKGRGQNLLWKKLLEAKKFPDKWFSMTLPIERSQVFSQEEIEEIKLSMSEERFSQEYLCSFDGAVPGAFFVKELRRIEANNQITDLAWDKSLPVHTAWDIGIKDKTAIWFFQLVGNKIHVIDYEEDSGLTIPDWCGILNRKPYTYGSHIAPHDIEVRSMDLPGAPTRRENARNFGIDFDVVIPRMSVAEGIEAARVVIDRCWFDKEKTDRGLICLRMCRPQIDKNGLPSNNPIHDEYSHGADAFRYLALGVEEVRSFNMRSYDWVVKDKPYGGWSLLG